MTGHDAICLAPEMLHDGLLEGLEERFDIAHILTDAEGRIASLSATLLGKLLPANDGKTGCAFAPGVNLLAACPQIAQSPCQLKGRWGRRISVSHYPAGAGRLYLLRDETSQSMTQQALREAAADAEAAKRAKHVFMSQTAHDFRTPLSLILGNADLLLDPSQAASLTPQISMALETIRSAGMVLMKNIDDMLELMQMEAGRIFADPGDYKFLPLLVAVMEGRRDNLDARNIRLDIPKPMARALAGLRVHVDRVLFKKALAHLFDYIIAVCGAGAVITLSASLKLKRSIELQAVFPTGVYSPEQVLEAFETSSPLPEMGLTGLASNHSLPLAARLMALHGGKLSMSRARGRKVRLSLRIPRSS